MKRSFGAGLYLLTLSLSLLGYTSCTGTNTGNGMSFCPAFAPCESPVSLTAPDGRTFRGRVYPGTSVASGPTGESETVAKLEFQGGAFEFADGKCTDDWPEVSERYGVQIFISKQDGTIDDAGTLHVHGAARDGVFASNPSLDLNASSARGWSVDLTLTKVGHLSATLSSSDELPGSAEGGAGGADGAAGTTTHVIRIEGPIAPSCAETIPAANGTFEVPCRTTRDCDISGG